MKSYTRKFFERQAGRTGSFLVDDSVGQ